LFKEIVVTFDRDHGIVADARTIRLGRRFGAVLLASHLVNDPEAGPAFLATAAAHLKPGGVVVGETYAPGWEPSASVGRTQMGDAWVETLSAVVDGDRLRAEVRYGVTDQVWQQPFRARLLGEAGLGCGSFWRLPASPSNGGCPVRAGSRPDLRRGRRVALHGARYLRHKSARNRTSVLARPTGFNRADATNIRIPIEGADANLVAEGG
jgi:hypothetical protein